MNSDQTWTFGTFDIVTVLLLHCSVGPYVFILYMMFHINVVVDNDDV